MRFCAFRLGHVKSTFPITLHKRVIKNVALNNWNAAVNIIFKHPERKEYIKEALRSTISTQLNEYCHSYNSVLKYSAPGTALWKGQWVPTSRKG